MACLLPTKFLFLQKLMDLYNLTFLWLGKVIFIQFFLLLSQQHAQSVEFKQSFRKVWISIYHKMKQIFFLVNNITYAKNAYIDQLNTYIERLGPGITINIFFYIQILALTLLIPDAAPAAQNLFTRQGLTRFVYIFQDVGVPRRAS